MCLKVKLKEDKALLHKLHKWILKGKSLVKLSKKMKTYVKKYFKLLN